MPSIAELPWLAPAPPNFRQICKSLTEPSSAAGAGAQIRFLASHRLGPPDAAFLGRTITRLAAAGASLRPLLPFKLAVLSGSVFDFVLDEMPAACARHGVLLKTVTTAFDQVAQSALDPGSAVNRSGARAALIAVDHRWLRLDHALDGDPAGLVKDAVERLRAIVAGLSGHGGITAILQTVPAPPFSLFGGFDRRVAGTQASLIERFNTALVALAAETGAVLADIDALACQIGTDRWFDPVQWALYKLPFAAACNAIYADAIGRLLGAMQGRARKCLVLDLDNTVWGGVVGDDGVESLKIGEGSALGESFLAVQKLALALKSRGIILAASSKNDDHNARLPFQTHPDMLLREGDFAAFQANWQDKPSNLEAVARQLDIGLDALVFLDDNAAERAQMRAALPEVAVPELPADPAWYPWYLANAGYFEAVAFSGEDRMRAQSYAARAARQDILASARDLGDYLAALDIEISFAPFDAMGRSRIAQLVNKSNQFNLTTKRTTEAEIAAFEQGRAAITLQVRLRDKFSDFGMIGVAIGLAADHDGGIVIELDTWLMSCRVLGRRVEEAMLAELVRLAREAGAQSLIGIYIPTERNHMVAEHYPKLGFSTIGKRPDGAHIFELVLADYQPVELPLRALRLAA